MQLYFWQPHIRLFPPPQHASACTAQDRNVQHADGGADASRLTAQARRKLASLGTTVEALADKLEALNSV